jgi:hypothetical protein
MIILFQKFFVLHLDLFCYLNQAEGTIDELNLSGVPNLEILKICGYTIDLTKSEPNLFKSLSKLCQLRFNRCTINNARADHFANLPAQLEVLELNQIDTNNFNYDDLNIPKKLKYLTVRDENLRKIDFVKTLNDLVVLRLCDGGEGNVKIDENTFNVLESLEVLQIEAKPGDWLNNLPKTLKDFSFKNEIYLEREFEYLDQINVLTNLEKFELRDYSTRRKVMKEGSFNNFKQLKTLYLFIIGLERFETFGTNLDNLTEIYIYGGPFLTTPFTLESNPFKNLLNLRKLTLFSFTNQMIGQNLFDDDVFSNLRELDMTRSEVELRPIMFAKLKNLRKLSLNRCESLHQPLPENLFVGLSELQELKMVSLVIRGEDRLRELNENCFNGLDNLKMLNLRDNTALFDEFNLAILEKVPKLKRLYIDRTVSNYSAVKYKLDELTIEIYVYSL